MGCWTIGPASHAPDSRVSSRPTWTAFRAARAFTFAGASGCVGVHVRHIQAARAVARRRRADGVLDLATWERRTTAADPGRKGARRRLKSPIRILDSSPAAGERACRQPIPRTSAARCGAWSGRRRGKNLPAQEAVQCLDPLYPGRPALGRRRRFGDLESDLQPRRTASRTADQWTAAAATT